MYRNKCSYCGEILSGAWDIGHECEPMRQADERRRKAAERKAIAAEKKRIKTEELSDLKFRVKFLEKENKKLRYMLDKLGG